MFKINTNMNNEPFLLEPIGKDYIWGGNRLKTKFAKDIELSPLAETWECSIHPNGESIVASGRYKGEKLSSVLIKNPNFLGTHPEGKLPILVKFIDAKENLSIQVHPDDEYALEHEKQLGKMEMWYVVEADDKAKIIYGFNKKIDEETLKKALINDNVIDYLNVIKIKKGDVFFIPNGTVHALLAGALVAEVQECSDITYRLYDYLRVDKNGNPRELHIEKALDVINFNVTVDVKQPLRIKKFYNGFCSELLCRCKYFQVERMLLNTEKTRKMAIFSAGSNSCKVLLCIDGCGVIMWDKGMIDFYRGDCIFVPANSKILKLHGTAQILVVGC